MRICRQLIGICTLLMAPELASFSKQVDNRTKRQLSIEEGINLPVKPNHGDLDLHLGIEQKGHGHPSVSCYQCSDRISCSKFEHTKKEDRVGYIKKCEGEEILKCMKFIDTETSQTTRRTCHSDLFRHVYNYKGCKDDPKRHNQRVCVCQNGLCNDGNNLKEGVTIIKLVILALMITFW